MNRVFQTWNLGRKGGPQVFKKKIWGNPDPGNKIKGPTKTLPIRNFPKGRKGLKKKGERSFQE